jgi:hypothetical protein
MRKLVTVAALLVATAVPAAASAQVYLGARLGYALPWGDYFKDAKIKDGINSQIPITLDLGLKLGKALDVGAYASYGFGRLSTSAKDDCDATGSTCSASTLRVGAQLNLHAENTATTDFWGGIAVGYEQIRVKDSKALIDDSTVKGFDATLQGGFDFLASQNLRIGPFVSVSIGQFTKLKTPGDEVKISDFTDTAFHGWFQLGVRGFYTL